METLQIVYLVLPDWRHHQLHLRQFGQRLYADDQRQPAAAAPGCLYHPDHRLHVLYCP
ncbi:hypothetical protein D3C71_2052740 [compost metagenome]